jgi:TonB-linked SusC/RagA family outer membrane protein
MRRYIFLFFLICSFSLPQNVYSQQTAISGKIYDSKSNSPVIGATVILKGTTTGTSSDINGAFQLNIIQELPVTLTISALGYNITEIDVYENEPIVVSLIENINKLNEVVVIGYGTQERKNLTSSISSIKSEDIQNVPKVNISEQLAGKAAGVQVISNTGIPGEGLFFRVRGSTSINATNEPLFIVDGVFINNSSLQQISTQGQQTNPLADISTADIQSIEILKDANATAIYGARAANGVVLITTKRGKYNQKPVIKLNGSYGIAWAPELWKLTTGPEYATLINEAWANDGKSFESRPFRPATDTINGQPGRGLPEDQPTYDRLNDIFRTARIQSYDLSVSGGTDKSKYFLGADYVNQEAVIRTNQFQRGGVRANYYQKLSKYVNISFSNSLNGSFRNQARVGDGPNGGILQAALHTPTFLPKYNADGTYAKWAGFDNLDVLIKYTNIKSKSYRYIGNFKVNIEFTKNLKFTSNLGLDFNDYDEFQYWNNLTSVGSNSNGSGSESDTKNILLTSEQILEYSKVFKEKHDVSVLAGYSQVQNWYRTKSLTGSNFPNNSYTLIGSAATTTGSADESQNALASYFGRVNYNFAGKYFISVSLRTDGSSKFDKSKRWGYFPSAGLAWQLKEENFLKNVKWLNSLKIRGSYGVTGNQNGIGNFASKSTWTGGVNYLGAAGTSPDQLGNRDLTWETTSQRDLGINIIVFNSRLDIDIDVYSKYTKDLLVSTVLPSKIGFNSKPVNDGEISNKGFEITINSLNIDKKNLKWSTTLNLAQNKNLIEKLKTPITQYSREWVRMEEGYPLYSFWLYHQLYVDPQTGDAVFEGQDNNGNVPVSARKIMGNTWPKLYGGINNSFQYKNFDLSIFFNFSYGNDVFNLNRFFLESGGTRDAGLKISDAGRALDAYQLDRWQKPGDITDVPRVTTKGNNYKNVEQNSRFLEDGSFLRLASLTLGYTLPVSITRIARIQKARVFFTGSNLWLWTKYKGPDPEINVTANQNIQGLDLGTVPQPRTVQFGINLVF